MTATIESNTQAILLLTAPLRSGPKGGDGATELLSLGEYNELARALHERQRTPSDLLGSDASELISDCHGALKPERLEQRYDIDAARFEYGTFAKRDPV